MKLWALKCCGCDRLMDKDGKPWELKGKSGIDVGAVIAAFDTKAEADQFASDHGWRAEGGDHRCPKCVERRTANVESRTGAANFARGAYVPTESL